MTRWADLTEETHSTIANGIAEEIGKFYPITGTQKTALAAVWSGVMAEFITGEVRSLYDEAGGSIQGIYTLGAALAMVGRQFVPEIVAILAACDPTDSGFVAKGYGQKETEGTDAKTGTEQVATDATVAAPDPLDLKVPDIRTNAKTTRTIDREDLGEKFRFFRSGGKTIAEWFHSWIERTSAPEDL